MAHSHFPPNTDIEGWFPKPQTAQGVCQGMHQKDKELDGSKNRRFADR